jgi:hypothetical protein
MVDHPLAPTRQGSSLLEDDTEHQADNHEQDDEAKECPEAREYL